MATHRSVNGRLRTAKSLATRREIALEWAALWRDHHENLIAQLEKSLGAGRIVEAGRLLGELKDESAKRFTGLASVIEKLADEDIV